MKQYDFPAWVKFGKMDSGETVITVELTEEEADRLCAEAKREDYPRMFECDAISDIYAKVYKLAVEQITNELKEIIEINEEDKDENDNWQADRSYPIFADFPEDLERYTSD